jgi:uncharacterized protein YwqG
MNKNLREICIELKENCGEKLNYPNNLGKRTRLGGIPDWIQEKETPICKKCGKKMDFIAQIDSIDYNSKKKEYMFGDVGMIYVFYCFNCEKTESVFQSF